VSLTCLEKQAGFETEAALRWLAGPAGKAAFHCLWMNI
jgi:hypothetical protein